MDDDDVLVNMNGEVLARFSNRKEWLEMGRMLDNGSLRYGKNELPSGTIGGQEVYLVPGGSYTAYVRDDFTTTVTLTDDARSTIMQGGTLAPRTAPEHVRTAYLDHDAIPIALPRRKRPSRELDL